MNVSLSRVQVLKLHVVPGVAPSALLRSGEKLNTISGTALTVHEAGSSPKFTAGGSIAAVITPDLMSCKGVVHIIDTVLVAPSMLAVTPGATAGVGGTTPESPTTGPGGSSADGTVTVPETQTPEPVPAPVAETPLGRPDHSAGVKPGPDGKWSICAGSWGVMSGNRPCGVRAATNGKITYVSFLAACNL